MDHELNRIIAFGATAWLIFIIWGLYLLIITIAVPWMIFKIRQDAKDSKELLFEIYSKLTCEPSHELTDVVSIAAKTATQQSPGMSSDVIPDMRDDPQAEEVSSQKRDHDLKYAPPELRK